MNRPKVWVVDDETELTMLVERVLGESYEVCRFNLPDDALSALDSLGAPDVILTDSRMPGMDGMEFISALRERKIYRPVVVISGYADRDLAIQTMRIGAFDLIEKPFDREELLSVVRRAAAHVALSQISERLLNACREVSDAFDKREKALAPDLLQEIIDRFRSEVHWASARKQLIERLGSGV